MNNLDSKTKGGLIVTILVVILLIGWGYYDTKQKEPILTANANLTQCLNENGTEFIGAWWCPNCTEQKKLLEGGEKDLPYTECYSPERELLPVCEDKNITAFPTWDFANGKRCLGVVHPTVLAHLSSCKLPNYGEEYTVQGLFEELVAYGLATSNETEERILQIVEARTNAINEYLNDNYSTSVSTETNINNLLTAISIVINRCS